MGLARYGHKLPVCVENGYTCFLKVFPVQDQTRARSQNNPVHPKNKLKIPMANWSLWSRLFATKYGSMYINKNTIIAMTNTPPNIDSFILNPLYIFS
jgi:hypothetical protein